MAGVGKAGGGRAGLGHRLVAAWARVRGAFGDGWVGVCLLSDGFRPSVSCVTHYSLARSRQRRRRATTARPGEKERQKVCTNTIG